LILELVQPQSGFGRRATGRAMQIGLDQPFQYGVGLEPEDVGFAAGFQAGQ
jgi:hypothetical protein